MSDTNKTPKPGDNGQSSGNLNEGTRGQSEGLNKGHIPDFKLTSPPPPKPNNPENKK
ncbi:hypothetical protein AAEO56_08095 [Flavobacterium sp. DGU11]|uniref:Uncharacterized protein n=1 Tax=Flavobacterium arundinis TaxID=3139143 RepID=A0ABU9HVM9_9FLAO